MEHPLRQGVDAADYDQDGWQDLFLDNIDHEMYSVYHNSGDQTFDDVAIQLGLGQTTRLMSGWGVKFFDYDNDRNLDLLIANRRPDSAIETRAAHVLYKEPRLLFRNTGQSSPKTFENVSSQAGPTFRETYSARGLAIADFLRHAKADKLQSD
jgi:hypothetical protein